MMMTERQRKFREKYALRDQPLVSRPGARRRHVRGRNRGDLVVR